MTNLELIKETMNRGMIEDIGELLGGGCSGKVYKILDNYNVKVYYKSETNEVDDEILTDLQGTSMFPKLYFSKKGEYIIKEHIEGCTLSNIAKAVEDGSSLVDIFDLHYSIREKVRAIFDYSLSKGYVPYDLDIDNVIVRNDGSLCVIDVGLFEKYSTIEDCKGVFAYIEETIQELVFAVSIEMGNYYLNKGLSHDEIKQIIINQELKQAV